MSAIVSIIEFKGDSGKTYSFNVYPINGDCLNESGVYVFTKRSLNSSTFKFEHSICFIGSGKSLPDKLYNHQKERCMDKKAANSVCFMPVSIAADRKKNEQDLLKADNVMCSEARGTNFLSHPNFSLY